MSRGPRLTNNCNSLYPRHFSSLLIHCIGIIPQLVVYEIFPEELEPLVENAEQKAANHGADEASEGRDSPKVKEDDFVVTAVEVHHHHHVYNRKSHSLLEPNLPHKEK